MYHGAKKKLNHNWIGHGVSYPNGPAGDAASYLNGPAGNDEHLHADIALATDVVARHEDDGFQSAHCQTKETPAKLI